LRKNGKEKEKDQSVGKVKEKNQSVGVALSFHFAPLIVFHFAPQ